MPSMRRPRPAAVRVVHACRLIEYRYQVRQAHGRVTREHAVLHPAVTPATVSAGQALETIGNEISNHNPPS